MRAPFLPPKKKMVSEEDIKKMETSNRLVTDEIKVNLKIRKNHLKIKLLE